MKWLSKWLGGGSEELGWDDLARRTANAIKKSARYRDKGKLVLPADTIVRIEVGEGSVDPIRQFSESDDFDRAVGAALANELDCEVSELPDRQYEVVVGKRTRIIAMEGAPRVWRAVVEGGDRSGEKLCFPRGARETRFGRGPWHGAEGSVRNDLVVCESADFVSRRAGRFFAIGPRLEVESLGQGDRLCVRRPDGKVIRPARTATGRVAATDGDIVELNDGSQRVLQLMIDRVRMPTEQENEDAGGDRE